MEFDKGNVTAMLAGMVVTGAGYGIQIASWEKSSKTNPDGGYALNIGGAVTNVVGTLVTDVGVAFTYAPATLGISVGWTGVNVMSAGIFSIIRSIHVKGSLAEATAISSSVRDKAAAHEREGFITGAVFAGGGLAMLIGGFVLASQASSGSTAAGPRNTFVAGAAKLLGRAQPTVFSFDNSGSKILGGTGVGLRAAF